MSDGHLCTRWFERGLGCPFDGAGWHTFSYNPDENFHFDEYPPEEDRKDGGSPPEEAPVHKRGDRGKPEERQRTRSPDDPFDYDEWLENNGLRSSSIAFTMMGYHVYGSLLLDQQRALKTKTTSGANLNVAPFTSTGGYLAVVEAAEIAVATRVGSGNTPKGLESGRTSFTQKPGLSTAEIAQVIIWATSIATAFGITRARTTPAGAALVIGARVAPPELMAFVANLGKNTPGIWGETVALAGVATSWLLGTREMAGLPERLRRNVYNQNAWADPGLG